jgi:hypothetical protein
MLSILHGVSSHTALSPFWIISHFESHLTAIPLYGIHDTDVALRAQSISLIYAVLWPAVSTLGGATE